mmetsp:Transcript_44895/g.126791  ORF Transcript_44895/g.126791 Transcript_44895/m.126791 type:complete len:215 (+) Transcript_44895:567-1211(+)
MSSLKSSSASTCLLTKTMICPWSNHSPNSCSNLSNFWFSGLTSTYCWMCAAVRPFSPMTISMGLCRMPRARASTWVGKVAENMAVCRSGRMFLAIAAICGSKPMSNMRSASSSTKYVTRLRLVTLPLLVVSTSIMRPGVATTISAPRLSLDSCSPIPVPPYTAKAVRSQTLQNRLTSCHICRHNSRVGVITSAIGPSPSLSGGWSSMCRSMGST